MAIDVTNLIVNVQSDIDALTGAEAPKDILKVAVEAKGLDVDITNLESAISTAIGNTDADTSETDLIALNASRLALGVTGKGSLGAGGIEIGDIVSTVADVKGEFELLDCDGREVFELSYPELFGLLEYQPVAAERERKSSKTNGAIRVYNLRSYSDVYISGLQTHSAPSYNDIFYYDISDASSVVKAWDDTTSSAGYCRFYEDRTSFVSKTELDVYCIRGYGAGGALYYQKSSNGGGIWGYPTLISNDSFNLNGNVASDCGNIRGKHFIIALNTTDGFYRSYISDDGASWTERGMIGNTANRAGFRVAYSADIDKILFAHTGDSSSSPWQFFLSTNDGVSFTDISSRFPVKYTDGSATAITADPAYVAVSPDGKYIAVGELSVGGAFDLQVSEDDGLTWSTIKIEMERPSNEWGDVAILGGNYLGKTFGFSSDNTKMYMATQTRENSKYTNTAAKYSLGVLEIDLSNLTFCNGHLLVKVDTDEFRCIDNPFSLDGEDVIMSYFYKTDSLERIRISKSKLLPTIDNAKIVAKELV